jgi:3-deoxy-D-manno-octulosonate cytidylyltransferase
MKKIAMIPARYAASRFPAKLVQTLGNKTVLEHTYDNTLATQLFDEVWVVTDSEIIFNLILQKGGLVKMSIAEHESGSDRIAEAIADMDIDIILNVQGDEPFVKKEPLAKLLQAFDDEKVQVASLMKKIDDKQIIENPNVVKVVVDAQYNSLLFSRSVIPYPRDATQVNNYYQHIGVYAYKKNALMQFTKWPITPLEAAEKIECLRYLEHGIPLRMVPTQFSSVAIDTPEDLEKAKQLLVSI